MAWSPTRCLAVVPADFVIGRHGHAGRGPHQRLAFKRSTLTCCNPNKLPVHLAKARCLLGGLLDTFTQETPEHLAAGSRLRPRHHPQTQGRVGPAVPPGAIPARVSVLLAGRRRPADPVSAPKLVHPHHGLQGKDAGQQRAVINLAADKRYPKTRRFKAIFSKTKSSIGPSRATHWGARRCPPSGCCEEDPATWRPSAS